MSSSEQLDLSQLVTRVGEAQGYWQLGLLWTPLISTEQTKGQYSLMEQHMPASVGPPPHVHDFNDEVFYILDGEMTMQLGEQVVVGSKGHLVRIPAGTAHGFVVNSDSARVLNFYVPGCLDMQVAMLGTPATSTTVPPEGAQQPPSKKQQQAFDDRLHNLATQTMAAVPDLLAQYRTGDSPMP